MVEGSGKRAAVLLLHVNVIVKYFHADMFKEIFLRTLTYIYIFDCLHDCFLDCTYGATVPVTLYPFWTCT